VEPAESRSRLGHHHLTEPVSGADHIPAGKDGAPMTENTRQDQNTVGVVFSAETIPTITLPWRNLPLTRLIHQNFAIIMGYAFSTPVLSKWVDKHFAGEWKYLGIALFERPVERANMALLELATQLRLLDNDENLSEYHQKMNYPELGKVIKQGEVEEPLYFRDMTNKIMHSSAISWNLSDTDSPIIVCHSPDPPRWVRAEIQLSVLAYYCGGMMS
jgi:hypothetical protein